MGNVHGFPWNRPLKSTDASAMFHALDVQGADRLTLKDLMAATDAGIILPHSLPALYFFDKQKDGCLTQSEFVDLLHFCHSEKRKVENALTTDKPLRDLILRASRAGVKDCSVRGRSSFRRFSSYSNVRSIFSPREGLTCSSSPPAHSASAIPPPYPKSETPSSMEHDPPIVSESSDSSEDPASPLHRPLPSTLIAPNDHPSLSAQESPVSSESGDMPSDGSNHTAQPCLRQCVAMYSSQSEFGPAVRVDGEEDLLSTKDLTDPQNRTALDAAVLENIMHANIHKLADLLHEEGMREKFMLWLWKLTDFNSSDVVTLEELRVLLSALSEDGIDVEELVFYKEVGLPLEECIINEFDTTHAGLLSRDEFMVFADLVTREYEFWENRHLERIGDYEMGRTIGRGSSGVVRLAMHVETREKVAIKIIKKGKCSDLSRLDREIQSLMAAKHEHIVALQEVLESETNLFIVMELCGGGSLVDMVRLYPEERMPEDTARFFMRQVFEALAFCHRNCICHRDVRLDNLMLDNAGNVKITDFGHSRIYSPGWDIFSTALVGSLYNISPEQISGRLYSGEKIDIWSAGVTVFCLLVGVPPFYEPDVTSLLQRISACEFEIPDFVSPKASDLIRCMIRANPKERITIQQMLHHPWFYDGPEFGPSMKVVVIPVDEFFKERPDIAEIMMAITIYQHNLHFHLADTQNPKASPEDQRGQDWTLKCLDPKNDIKFTISLFSKEPVPLKKQMKKGHIPTVASCATLSELSMTSEAIRTDLRKTGSIDVKQSEPMMLPQKATILPAALRGLPEDIARMTPRRNKKTQDTGGAKLLSASRPPLHRKVVKITPLDIAAHLRERGPNSSDDCDEFDFDSDDSSHESSAYSSDNAEEAPREEKHENGSVVRRRKQGRHSRSHSLDDPDVMRVNRSATVDAFPYQKVYPQRAMPDSARNLNFDMPEVSSGFGEHFDCTEESPSDTFDLDKGSTQLNRFHRSVTLHAVSSLRSEPCGRASGGSASRDNEIALKLSRHPSKGVSPQSPQIRVSPQESMLAGVDDLTLTSAKSIASPLGYQLNPVPDKLQHSVISEIVGAANTSQEPSGKGFQPYIEVRWQDGESGVFLKICRKLKNICTTKLATTAERQKRKSVSRRNSSTFRRSSSSRSISSELTTNGSAIPVRARTFESSVVRASGY